MKYTFLVLLVMRLTPCDQESCMDAREICMTSKCYNSCAVKVEKRNGNTCHDTQKVVSPATQQSIREGELLKEARVASYRRWIR